MDGQVVCRFRVVFQAPARSLGLWEEETKGADDLITGARAVKRGDKRQQAASARNDRGDGRGEEEMAWAFVRALYFGGGRQGRRRQSAWMRACLFRAYSVLLFGAAAADNSPGTRSIRIVRMCSRLRSMGPGTGTSSIGSQSNSSAIVEGYCIVPFNRSAAQHPRIAKKGGQGAAPTAPQSRQRLEIAYRGVPPGLSIGSRPALPQLGR